MFIYYKQSPVTVHYLYEQLAAECFGALEEIFLHDDHLFPQFLQHTANDIDKHTHHFQQLV